MNVPGRYSRLTQVGGVSVCVGTTPHPDPFRTKLATSQPQDSSAKRGESVGGTLITRNSWRPTP